MAGKGQDLQWKIVGGIGAVAAAFLARQAITGAWRTATGKEPPANPESPETTWGEAVTWAVLSGAAIGIARLAVTRQAATLWRKRKGNLPPGLETVS